MKFTLAKSSLTPKKVDPERDKTVLAGLKSAFAGNKEIVASLEERFPHLVMRNELVSVPSPTSLQVYGNKRI